MGLGLRHMIIVLLILAGGEAIAQEKFTISGKIKDAANGEDIPFTNVLVKELSGVGATSNVYGFYSLTIPEGDYTLIFRFVGYQTLEKTISLRQDMTLDVELEATATALEAVVITSEAENENVTNNEGSVTKISMNTVKEVPTFGGEPDILRIAQMNPGIKTAGEGNSGFYVRGGGLDQNLVLIDEAPVYNPSHVLGFFSVFNGDALKGATVYKGGMLPEYGGKTASVMDIRMKDGNSKEFQVTGGIGLIASRLTFEGPIVKDKGSFMISGRRSYADLYLRPLEDDRLNSTKLFFHDLNLKANYQITEKDKIYVSGYLGRDVFGYRDDFGFDWGNITGTLRWNHVISNKMFSNTSLIYSNYDYNISVGSESAGEDIEIKSQIEDFNLKQDFSFYPNSNNSIKFGFNVIHHTITSGSLDGGENSGINSDAGDLSYGYESAIYLQNEQKINDKWSANYGLRYSFFHRIGPGSEYLFDSEGNLISEETFSDGSLMEYMGGLEPRLAATYLLNKKSSLKFVYNRNYQYLHLLTGSTASTPIDVWVMSSNNIKPQQADQISLGYFRNFKKNVYEASAEVYYKSMQNVIDYKTGANTFLNSQLESDLIYGTGEAYGLELFLKKTKGDLTGWVGYTISRTTRKFDEINDGKPFSAKQDRTHDISVVAMYKINKKLSASGSFIFYTGDAVTFPTGQYTVEGITTPYYTERNGYRMPNYHRMDLGLTWYLKKTDKLESSWNFSVYNAYGRENPYIINFEPNEDNPNINNAVQISLFRWVPSVTYNFKF
ncbi:TonB-dependent receptor [bacterium SCSIO 12643]|nr:TonB-dependent receptor [bacterium SCSIO 12643]